LLRRFHPEMLSQTMRAAVRNFIKQTNLDTYERLCEIFDFVADCNPRDDSAIRSFARDQRTRVDRHSATLLVRGERVLNWLEATYARKEAGLRGPALVPDDQRESPLPAMQPGVPQIPGLEFIRPGSGWEQIDLFGVARAPVPYDVFRLRLAEYKRSGDQAPGCASPQPQAAAVIS